MFSDLYISMKSITESVVPKSMNFTQFALSRGLPSDYDITDHSDLSPSGRVSKTQRSLAQDRMRDRWEKNALAHKLFQEEIDAGRIVDTSGKYEKSKPKPDARIEKVKAIRRRAEELNNLADRGMQKTKFRKFAVKLNSEADALEAEIDGGS